jgi:L-ribulose-5-phosphate 4-epimerase
MNYSQTIDKLRELVCEANLELFKSGLIVSTFGNVSEKIEFENDLIIGIKPSGISYPKLKSNDIVILNQKGEILEGSLRPSSDTPTHLHLYRELPHVFGISHTHSVYATAWAQTGLDIPIYGTTHADYANKPIPCTEDMSTNMIQSDYELNTGVSIVNCLNAKDMINCPMIIVKNHGPFTMGTSSSNSVENAVILEQIAKIAFVTRSIKYDTQKANDALINKHYDRKHGKNKYYGQN